MAKRSRPKHARRPINERIADLEAQIAKLHVVGKGREMFSPEAVRKDRKRLDLTLVEYARLAGLSKNTVHGWEHHLTRPHVSELERWVGVKRMSKEAAWKKLGIKQIPKFSGKAVLAERKTRRAFRTTDARMAFLQTRLAKMRAVARGTEKFSAEAVRKDRERLELTAKDYADLVGVSMITIYSWEKGRTQPRASQLERWLAVKGMPKDAAWGKLGIEELPPFKAKEVLAERKRLGLSAAKYAELVGVSMLTVYNWEKGNSAPGEQAMEKWLAVKGIGKAAAAKKLGLK